MSCALQEESQKGLLETNTARLFVDGGESKRFCRVVAGPRCLPVKWLNMLKPQIQMDEVKGEMKNELTKSDR